MTGSGKVLTQGPFTAISLDEVLPLAATYLLAFHAVFLFKLLHVGRPTWTAAGYVLPSWDLSDQPLMVFLQCHGELVTPVFASSGDLSVCPW